MHFQKQSAFLYSQVEYFLKKSTIEEPLFVKLCQSISDAVKKHQPNLIILTDTLLEKLYFFLSLAWDQG